MLPDELSWVTPFLRGIDVRLIRICFSGKVYKKDWPCVSSQIQSHDVAGAIFVPRLMSGAQS